MQPTLFDIKNSIQQRFENWLSENQGLYELFEMSAIQLIQSGRKRIGSKAICENIRWNYQLNKGNENFRLNNNFSSRLARLFVERNPQYKQFIELRELKKL